MPNVIVNFTATASPQIRTFSITVNGQGMVWTQRGGIWAATCTVITGASNALQFYCSGTSGGTLVIEGKSAGVPKVSITGSVGASPTFDVGFAAFTVQEAL